MGAVARPITSSYLTTAAPSGIAAVAILCPNGMSSTSVSSPDARASRSPRSSGRRATTTLSVAPRAIVSGAGDGTRRRLVPFVGELDGGVRKPDVELQRPLVRIGAVGGRERHRV